MRIWQNRPLYNAAGKVMINLIDYALFSMVIAYLFKLPNYLTMKILLSITFLLLYLAGFGQSKFTTKDMINKELIYSFTGGDIFIIISSDSTLFWRNDSKPKEAHEKSKTIHINEHTVMTSWYESDKTFVTLLSDWDKLKVSGMVCRADGKFYPIEGSIKLKNN